MDREIKFRGKDINDVWRYGYLFQGETGNNEKYSVVLKQSRYNSDDRLGEDLPFAFYKDEVYIINMDTIGQFTGLTDKNGKEIYESDIIKTPLNNIVSVQFGYKEHLIKNTKMRVFDSFACYGWVVKNIKNGMIEFLDNSILEGEVIGNIHDNPDLLEG